MTPFVFRTTCKLDITYFPFDDQHCDFEIGSWAYTGDQFNISSNYKLDAVSMLASYSESSTWQITGRFCLFSFTLGAIENSILYNGNVAFFRRHTANVQIKGAK